MLFGVKNINEWYRKEFWPDNRSIHKQSMPKQSGVPYYFYTFQLHWVVKKKLSTGQPTSIQEKTDI